jgi:hypothetical protein
MCSLLICKPFFSNIVLSSKALNICRATLFLGLDMCGHSCCLGSKESHFVGYANAIGAGIVRFFYYLPVDGELKLKPPKRYVPGIPIAAQTAGLAISGHFLDPR